LLLPLRLFEAATGNQTDQPITLTFTDGSTTTWTQTFTDWANGDGNKNNSPPSGSTLASTNEALVATLKRLPSRVFGRLGAGQRRIQIPAAAIPARPHV